MQNASRGSSVVVTVGGDDKKVAANTGERAVVDQNSRDVYLYSDIDSVSAAKCVSELRKAKRDAAFSCSVLGIDALPPRLHINCNGGAVFDSWSIADVVKEVGAETYIEGNCASGASLVAFSGSWRYMTAHSYVLIHQLNGCMWGTFEAMKDDDETNKLLMDGLYRFYVEYTNIKRDDLIEMMKHDLWLDAKTALEYGMIDEII